MKKIVLLIALFGTYLCMALPAEAAIKKLAQTGLQFLKVDVGARPAAMGGSYAMIGSDVTAMFYNPAGLSKMESNYQFFASQTQWISEITYNAGAAAVQLGNWGVVGLSIISADYGEIEGTRVSASEAGFERTGNLDVGAYAVGLSYGRSISERFSIGGQLKYAYQNLGNSLIDSKGTEHDNSVGGLAFDFGTMFYPGFRSFRLGMFVRNFSPQFKYEKEAFQLPLTFAIGFAMDLMDVIGSSNSSLLLSVDALHPRDYTERLHIGAEYEFLDMLALRGGYKFNYDEEGLTGGIGFKQTIGGVLLDIGYAYSEFGVFNSVNRFSINFAF